MNDRQAAVEAILKAVTALIDHIAVLRARARWEKAARRALRDGTSYEAKNALRMAERYDERAG